MLTCKRFLASTLIVLIAFQVFLSNFHLPTAQAASTVSTVVPITQTELKEARTEKSKTFLKSDGTKQLVTYQKAIHYPVVTRGTTVWNEIDDTLVKTPVATAMVKSPSGSPTIPVVSTNLYKNKANDFTVSFSDKITQIGAQIAKDKASVSITPKTVIINGKLSSPYNGNTKKSPTISTFLSQKSQTPSVTSPYVSTLLSGNIYPSNVTPVAPISLELNAVVPTVLRNMLTYKNVASDTDLIYYSVDNGIKEDIVLNKYYGQNTFKFDINITNAIFGKNADGSYVFYDKTTKKQIFYMPKMYMWDSKGGKGGIDNEYSFAINSVILPKLTGGFELTVTVDHDWLANPARVYPITIDPSINDQVPYGLDTYVQEGYPNYNMWVNRDMYVGRGSTKLRTRAFVPFNVDLNNKQINSAQVSVYQIYCVGACTYSNVGVYTSGDYDPKGVTWNNQPGAINWITANNNSGTETWLDFNVTDALKHWFEAKNPTGSKVGSFEFVQENEGTWGYRQWVAENNPDAGYDDKGPHLIVNYSDYGAAYSFSGIHNAKVNDRNYSATLNITNTGADSYWDQSNTFARISILNRTTGQAWGINKQIPYGMGNGSGASIPFSFDIPDSAGDYVFYADIYKTNFQCGGEGVCYLSDLGVSEGQASFNVSDYPVYSDEILVQYPAAYQAGSTVPITVAVHNTGRLQWDAGAFSIGYKLIDSENGLEISNGKSPLSSTIFPVWTGDASYLTAQVNFKSPLKTGKFSLVFDLWQDSVGWFSSKGVTTSSKDIEITSPSLASILHLGIEDRYAMIGPVDASTGGLIYSVGDVSNPTITGGINIGRNYNSNISDNNFSSDSNGYITKWLVNGPYYESDQNIRFNKSYINELALKPNEGLTTNNRLWFSANSSGSLPINLKESYLNTVGIQNTENLATYANVYAYSDKTQSVQLKIGSDDGLKVWLNGSLVHSNNINRGSVADNDTVPVSLNAGWNQILLKITQGVANHGFIVRFTDPANLPITNLRYTLNNPSIIQNSTVFGKNWSPSFGERLDLSDGQDVYYLDGSNSINIYTKKSDGTYIKPAGSNLDLVKNPDGTYSMVDKYGYKNNYRADGKILNRVDLFSSTINYQYDSAGNCVKIFDKTADGKSTRYLNIIYTNGLVSSITNQLNTKLIQYTYSPDGYLSKVTDQLGNFVSYVYDSNGKMVENIDKKGQKTLISYTGGKVTKLTDSLGSSTTLAYSSGKVEVTNPLGYKSSINYDPIGKMMTKSTDATGYSEKYEYDANYNVTRVYPMIPENDGLFYSSDFSYDKNGNLTSVVDPLGNKTTTEYLNNYPIKQTDPLGNVVTNTYDTKGQVLTTTDAKGSVSLYTYDAYGHMLTSTDPLGNKTINGYNSEGDLVSMTSPKGDVTTFTFDNTGKQISQKSPLGVVTQFGYDVAGRMISVKDMSNLTTKIEYDANNNITKQINPRGFSKSYTYNSVNQLTSITDEVGAKISYEYDLVGNQTKLIDANGKATSYQYDALGQLTKVTDSEGKSSVVQYDKNGNITNTSDFNGVVYSQKNNKAGDPVEITSPDGTYTIKYDKNGNITEVASKDQKSTVTYDKNDNPTSQVSQTVGNVTNEYDKNNNLTKVTTASTTVGLTYDANSQISQISQTITSTGQTLVSKISLDKGGKLSTLTKSNGDISSYTYDASQRVTTLTNRNIGKAIISRYSYQYDAASNITAIAEDRTKTVNNYGYDARNQLVKENAISYAYDPMGNRIQMVNGSETLTYSYDPLAGNELAKVTSNLNTSATSYVYDNNGNLTQKTDATGVTKYSYDTDGYFVSAVLPDKTTVVYTYDKLAKLRTSRVQTNPDGTVNTVKFVWDNDRLIAETDGTGKTLKVYAWDEGERLVSVSLPDSAGVLKTFYYGKNAKGDITSITDQTGKRVADYEYDAWGKIKKSTTLSGSSIPNIDKVNVRLYGGYWYDATLGSYFMKIRLYDPSIGRFLSKDPIKTGINPVDYNPYVYCANNPVNSIDPSGKFLHIVIGAAIGAIVGAAIDATVQYATKGSIDWKQVGKAAVVGAVAGGVLAATAGILGGGLVGMLASGAIAGAAASLTDYTINNWGNLSWKGAAKSVVSGAVVGAVTGVVGYGVGKVLSKVVSAATTSRISTTIDSATAKVASKATTAPFRAAPAPEPTQYNSFGAAKSDLGSAGVGKEWHHIVEQCQKLKSGFSVRMLNSTDNLIAIDADVHRKISSLYSSIKPYSNGLRVRNWLAGQSYEAQIKFGMDALRDFGALN